MNNLKIELATMTPERWHRVEEVLQAALDRAPEGRSAFLLEACLGDEELRRETTSLMQAYEVSAEFLEEPAISQDAQVFLDHDEHRRIGQQIGPYEIIQRIGSGGMGDIYLAHDGRLDRLVALKLLRSYFLSDAERLRRFQTEARAASALNHTNILTIYDVGQSEQNFYIAAEYIAGDTVGELISGGALSLSEVLDIILQLLGGLSAAHTAGIIHRDIKPENIIRRRDGVLKILDFGIAKLLEQSSETARARTQTETGVIVGTIGYMSPEQVRGLPVDERTDIWSCGVVLYEMLATQRPFAGTTNADTLVAMLEREPEPLFGASPQAEPLLRRLHAVVHKALSKDPSQRYQTAAEMLAALQGCKQELENNSRGDAAAIMPQTRVSELREAATRTIAKRTRRRRLLFAGATVLLLFVAATFLYQRVWLNGRSPSVTAAAARPYLRMTESEQLAFVAAQEQRISAMMGEHPRKLNDEALRAIKTHVDRYAARSDGLTKPGEEPLRTIYGRAAPQIPIIVRAFNARKIPIVIGIYLPMVESAYRPCFENAFGAKGLFQFLPGDRRTLRRITLRDV